MTKYRPTKHTMPNKTPEARLASLYTHKDETKLSVHGKTTSYSNNLFLLIFSTFPAVNFCINTWWLSYRPTRVENHYLQPFLQEYHGSLQLDTDKLMNYVQHFVATSQQCWKTIFLFILVEKWKKHQIYLISYGRCKKRTKLNRFSSAFKQTIDRRER